MYPGCGRDVTYSCLLYLRTKENQGLKDYFSFGITIAAKKTRNNQKIIMMEKGLGYGARSYTVHIQTPKCERYP